MIDAHDLHQRLLEAWRQLCRPPSATQVTNPILDVPVYVEVDNRLEIVKNIKIIDDKIVLET